MCERRPKCEQTISLGDFINSHDVHRLSQGKVDVGAAGRQAKIRSRSISSPHQWKQRIARMKKVARVALKDSEHLTPD
jgi:hypothetical protein